MVDRPHGFAAPTSAACSVTDALGRRASRPGCEAASRCPSGTGSWASVSGGQSEVGLQQWFDLGRPVVPAGSGRNRPFSQFAPVAATEHAHDPRGDVSRVLGVDQCADVIALDELLKARVSGPDDGDAGHHVLEDLVGGAEPIVQAIRAVEGNSSLGRTDDGPHVCRLNRRQRTARPSERRSAPSSACRNSLSTTPMSTTCTSSGR